MKTIHAYHRKKTHIITWGAEKIAFQPNEFGDIVCDVTDESLLERLAQIPEAYRVYAELLREPALISGLGDVKAPEVETFPPEVPDAPVVSPHLIQDGEGNLIDLQGMADDQLKEFCTVNDIKVAKTAKGDALRDKIVAALKAPE